MLAHGVLERIKDIVQPRGILGNIIGRYYLQIGMINEHQPLPALMIKWLFVLSGKEHCEVIIIVGIQIKPVKNDFYALDYYLMINLL